MQKKLITLVIDPANVKRLKVTCCKGHENIFEIPGELLATTIVVFESCSKGCDQKFAIRANDTHDKFLVISCDENGTPLKVLKDPKAPSAPSSDSWTMPGSGMVN